VKVPTNKKPFKVGDAVICNGYPGTVTKVCAGQLRGMVEVKVPGGLVCVSAGFPDCYHVRIEQEYRIISSAGVDLGTYSGASPEDVLDALARDAGYRDAEHATEVAGAFDGTVEEVGRA
jgi:hypothetical protein